MWNWKLVFRKCDFFKIWVFFEIHSPFLTISKLIGKLSLIDWLEQTTNLFEHENKVNLVSLIIYKMYRDMYSKILTDKNA